MMSSDPTIETFRAGDGYTWKYRVYRASMPRAHLICLHGIQSHGGWYERSCRFLTEAGYNVHFLDRRGSGLNETARGDTPSFHRLLDDIEEYTTRLRDTPMFVLAISWGGKLAVALQRRFAERGQGPLRGLVLLCPGLCPRIHPSLLERLRIAFARLVRPGKLFDIPLNDPALFTADPARQEWLRDDPLQLHQATARLLVESFRLDRYVLRAAPHIRIPVLLMLAGQDRIIDNQQTRTLVETFATNERKIIEYPEAHHTLEFEPEPERYLNELRMWLDRQITP